MTQPYIYTHHYSCRGFASEEEEKTTAQIRAEIDSHLEGKRRVESTLPQSIVIGPFYVNIHRLGQSGTGQETQGDCTSSVGLPCCTAA